MRKFKYAFAITAITSVVAAGLLVSAVRAQDGSSTKQQEPAVKKITVEGTLIDTKCYAMNHANVGNDHQSPDGLIKGCAAKCAKDGIPVGVLQKNGKVLVLAAPAKAFAPYMAQHVRVTGTPAFEGSIVPDKVEARSADGKWKEIEITTMM